MSLSYEQRNEISELLTRQIRRKLAEYAPETHHMPFHTRLLGEDRMALFSFIHSINTTLGTSVFEQVAVIIGRPNFKRAVHLYKGFNNTISHNAQQVIQTIMDDLIAARRQPNKAEEIAQILDVAKSENVRTIKRPTIDIFIEAIDGTEFYFDMKTAKPNIEGFIELKRKLLEWVAIRGAIDPSVNIRTLLAIPYNPYEPQPYQRWTLQGLFDLQNEILVAEEFWNFLGGQHTYEDVLRVFEDVGIALRPEIDGKFAAFSP